MPRQTHCIVRLLECKETAMEYCYVYQPAEKADTSVKNQMRLFNLGFGAAC